MVTRETDLAILGIDAAWTTRHASGVAVIRKYKATWHYVAAAASYEQFLTFTPEDGPPFIPEFGPHDGSRQRDMRTQIKDEVPRYVVRDIVAHAKTLAQCRIAVVAVDMPLSPAPITRRRPCDTSISRAFGKYQCAVHSPTPTRPGAVSTAMLRDLQSLGYHLNTDPDAPDRAQTAIEVYPHPAIVRLLGLNTRLCYKASRSRRYWPGTAYADRIENIRANLEKLHRGLATRIHGIPPLVPQDLPSLAAAKPYEDTLDALVCAYVGARYWEGLCEAYGEASGVIWVQKET